MSFARPARLSGSTSRVRTAHGNLYVTVNTYESTDDPVEVFAALGKAGSCDFAFIEAVTRLASIGLQYGVPVAEISRQMRGITCHPFLVNGEGENLSPLDAIGRVLLQYVKEA